MTDKATRYDELATRYDRWWAPVLVPGVRGLLDRVARLLEDGPVRAIDIGTGTGQLAFEALRRWPELNVVGVDASEGMRAMADGMADELLGPGRDRFTSEVAFADRLPFPDSSFDAAISSFVFQMVPSRARALREARRVLRPGGVLAYVSWLQDDRSFEPDRIFDEELAALGFDEPEPEGRPGDIPSVERAVGELRRAGFSEAAAEREILEHRYTPHGYLSFLTEYDETSLFEDLEPDEREQLEKTMLRRLGRLSAEQLTIRYPIVYATGRRSRKDH